MAYVLKKVKRHHDQVKEVLKDCFQEFPFEGIEIGTNAGDLTRTLLRDFPNLKKLFTIDPWSHFPGAEFEAGHGQEYHDEQKKAAYEKLMPYKDRVEVFQMTSDDFFALSWPRKEETDFVWIDGHHSYAQAKRDIENAIMVVREGGVIGGHDYGLVGGVTKAVDEICGDNDLDTGGDFTWWFYV